MPTSSSSCSCRRSSSRRSSSWTRNTCSVATAYGAFLAADVLGASGVLATIAAGMTLGVLGRRSGWLATGGSARLLVDLWAFLAFIANAGLFLLVGLRGCVNR